MKSLFKAIVIILLLFFLSELILPPLLTDQAERYLRENSEDLHRLDIEFDSRPALRLFTGRIERVALSAAGLKVPDLVEIESLEVELADLKLDIPHLIRRGELRLDNFTTEKLKLSLTEDAINTYFQEYEDLPPGFRFTLLPDEVLLRTRLKAFEREVDIGLSGTFEPVPDFGDEGVLAARYVVDAVNIEQLSLPRSFFSALVEDLELYLILEGLPVPVVLEEVKVEEGRLIMYGR